MSFFIFLSIVLWGFPESGLYVTLASLRRKQTPAGFPTGSRHGARFFYALAELSGSLAAKSVPSSRHCRPLKEYMWSSRIHRVVTLCSGLPLIIVVYICYPGLTINSVSFTLKSIPAWSINIMINKTFWVWILALALTNGVPSYINWDGNAFLIGLW